MFNNGLMGVSFEMTPNNIILQQAQYNFIEFCKDAGGFIFFAVLIAGALAAIANYNSGLNWAVVSLFRKKSSGRPTSSGKPENLKFSPYSQSSILNLLQSLSCWRMKRQDRVFSAGRKAIKRHINLATYVRFVRFMERAVKHKVPEKIKDTLTK